jgi:hypothetical protein
MKGGNEGLSRENICVISGQDEDTECATKDAASGTFAGVTSLSSIPMKQE